MANDFYNAAGAPTAHSPGTSATVRSEFANIGLGFDKMPAMSGFPAYLVRVNAGGTGLESATVATAIGSYIAGLGYLTAATAASTYLTTATAASTYLTTATAASTYLTTALAASTYYPKTGGTVSGSVTATSFVGPLTGNASTASDSALLNGLASTSAATASTIAARDASGYLFAAYLNQSSGNNENPTISQVLVTNGGDNFLRKSSLASLLASFSGTAGISISGNAATATTATNQSGGTVAATTITASSTISATGLVFGRSGGGTGLGRITTTTTTGSPAGTSTGDLVLVY